LKWYDWLSFLFANDYFTLTHRLILKHISIPSICLITCFKQTSAIHLLTQPSGSYSPLSKHLLLTKLIYTQDICLITCFKQISAPVFSWFLHLLPAIQLPTKPPGYCSPIRHLATTCFWPNWFFCLLTCTL
jgi:hypothetical protein